MSAESEIGAQLRIGIPRAVKEADCAFLRPTSLTLADGCFGVLCALIAFGTFALLALGFAVLAVAFQLAAALLKHAGI